MMWTAIRDEKDSNEESRIPTTLPLVFSGPLASKGSRELKSRALTYLSPKGLANAAGATKKGRRTMHVEKRIAGEFDLWSVVVL